MKTFTPFRVSHYFVLCLLGILMSSSVMAQGPKYAYWESFSRGATVMFNDLSSASGALTASSYAWDFGDGATSTMEHPSHTYAANGAYLASLTVTWSDASTSTFSNAVTINALRNSIHDDLVVNMNSSNNILDVLANDGYDAGSANVIVFFSPNSGMATITANKEISYTPNNGFTGWDHMSYQICDAGNCDTADIFIQVRNGDCGYTMSLTPYFMDCGAQRFCGSGNWQHASAPLVGANTNTCYGYKFTFRNPTGSNVDQLHASIEIDSLISIVPGSGRVLHQNDLVSTSANVSVDMDMDNNRIMLSLDAGQTIAAGEDYAFVFQVNLDNAPQGGNLHDYFTNLAGSAHCGGVEGRVYDQPVTARHEMNCKTNHLVVTPRGCGVWGDVDTTVKRLTTTVNFENTTAGTVNEINIRDILPQAYEPFSIVVEDGHPFVPEVKVGTNQQVDFYFHDANLPSAATDSIGGQGHVTFSVALKPGLPAGTPVDNWADIYFDNAAPIRTDTTFNTIFAAVSPRPDLGADIFLEDCDSCLTITPTVVAGGTNRTYLWTTGSTNDTITVCPTDSSYVGVWVTNTMSGCVGYDRINIDVDCNLVNTQSPIEALSSIAVFPNPFEGATTFQIEAGQNEYVVLEIFAPTGRKVADVYQGMVSAGQSMKIDFDAQHLAAGVYIYNLTHENGNTQSGRLAIVK
ncbi:MAG: PKD domain-containing protein [Bacteroidota bacterium]